MKMPKIQIQTQAAQLRSDSHLLLLRFVRIDCSLPLPSVPAQDGHMLQGSAHPDCHQKSLLGPEFRFPGSSLGPQSIEYSFWSMSANDSQALTKSSRHYKSELRGSQTMAPATVKEREVGMKEGEMKCL